MLVLFSISTKTSVRIKGARSQNAHSANRVVSRPVIAARTASGWQIATPASMQRARMQDVASATPMDRVCAIPARAITCYSRIQRHARVRSVRPALSGTTRLSVAKMWPVSLKTAVIVKHLASTGVMCAKLDTSLTQIKTRVSLMSARSNTVTNVKLIATFVISARIISGSTQSRTPASMPPARTRIARLALHRVPKYATYAPTTSYFTMEGALIPFAPRMGTNLAIRLCSVKTLFAKLIIVLSVM